MLVTTGMPWGVGGRVVLVRWRVTLQVLLRVKPRASVVAETLSLASNTTLEVRFVGTMALVSSRRELYWKLVAKPRPLVRVRTSPRESFRNVSVPRPPG